MSIEISELLEDVNLSFKLFEFVIRVMSYAELGKVDENLFGQKLCLNLDEQGVVYNEGEFCNKAAIVRVSQMNVGAAFGATAISLKRLLEGFEKEHIEVFKKENIEIATASKLIRAVRNAFSHRIAAPTWYVKSRRFEILDLNFIGGPKVDLKALNGTGFDYKHIGGLAVWYRLKSYLFACLPTI